jgi:glycosyltransferase involved in cell wall biosynthesis
MPKVSVIIPTYNYGKFIDEALASVFNQTFQDFEIIVIDDGSTDNTRQRISTYGDRVRYFYQEQKGPAAARNLGIRESRGEYIAFLDADDLWYPAKLEKQMALFESNPRLGMVLSDNALFDDNGIYKSYVNKKRYLFSGGIITNIFLRSGVVTPTVIVRKAVFKKVGLFEESLHIAEDDNMWIRIAIEYEVGIVDESLAQIRDHCSRTMRVSDKLEDNVSKNIQMLISKYGSSVADKIRPLASQKYCQLYLNVGYQKFTEGEYTKARARFLMAAAKSPFSLKIYVYLLATYVPGWARERVRKARKLISLGSPDSARWTRAQFKDR